MSGKMEDTGDGLGLVLVYEILVSQPPKVAHQGHCVPRGKAFNG